MTGSGSIPPDPGGRVFLEEGMVLHRRAYRETSLLVDLFTAGHGRLRLIAKGARRGRNAPAQLLQPFVPVRLSWAGRGELPTLTGVEAAGSGFGLDGSALFCGFYMNELLLHLLPLHDPHPAVFRLYRDTLKRLHDPQGRETALRGFEAGLLEEIGYGLSLDREATAGQAIEPGKLYAYVVEQGPVEIAEPRADAVHGATLLGLKHKRLDDPAGLSEAKRLLRRVIHHYLNGRPLKSRDLFKPSGGNRSA
jgi:DNA repair protein RecO (recombination protein O)